MSEHAEHTPTDYVKIWAILVVLLVISVIGPMLEIRVVTLITAFGIAVIKAYLVAKNFMHITLEPKFVSYFVVTALVFMLLFFAGTAPDVMKDEGTQWQKPAWKAAAAAMAPAGHGSGEHH
jgi:caa(3)-type oxidase subunit IV